MSNVLRTISMALLLLWFLGMVTGHTLGGFIHAFSGIWSAIGLDLLRAR